MRGKPFGSTCWEKRRRNSSPERVRASLVMMGVVFPAEGHLGRADREEAMVGNGHAMGIASEIMQDVLGSRGVKKLMHGFSWTVGPSVSGPGSAAPHHHSFAVFSGQVRNQSTSYRFLLNFPRSPASIHNQPVDHYLPHGWIIGQPTR
jgi:hypothetical protein